MHSALDCIWSTTTENQAADREQRKAETSSSIAKRSSAIHKSFQHTCMHAAVTADWVSEYKQMVAERVRDGWTCYLVTLMFEQLPGSRVAVMNQMKDRVQGVYSKLVTRVNRKPKKASVDELPVLLGFADLPVHKRNRASVQSVRCNDGIHFHALVLLPPSSRLKESLVDHFRQNERVYAGPDMSIQRIHVEPVTEECERVVDYVTKTVRRRRLSYEDAILVLPRSQSEL